MRDSFQKYGQTAVRTGVELHFVGGCLEVGEASEDERCDNSACGAEFPRAIMCHHVIPL